MKEIEPATDPVAFWEARIAEDPSLRSVGHIGLGTAYNRWLYQARQLATSRLIRRAGLRTDGTRLLDLGTGIGAWIPFWRKLSVREIVGIDVSKTAVRRAQERFPSCRFLVGDVSRELPVLGPFDVVTAFDVLYHIVEENAFAKAIQNIAGLVSEDGAVIIMDGFGRQPRRPSPHVHFRSRLQYERALERNGLAILAEQPVFFLLEVPLDPFDSRWDGFITSFTGSIHRAVNLFAQAEWETINGVVGMALFCVDAVATANPARIRLGLKTAMVGKRV